jgi:hypothetical protein
VPGKYEEIALLDSRSAPLVTGMGTMFNSMRKKAGKLGANAIILDAMSEPDTTGLLLGNLSGGMERKGKAVAIYVFPKKSSSKKSASAQK